MLRYPYCGYVLLLALLAACSPAAPEPRPAEPPAQPAATVTAPPTPASVTVELTTYVDQANGFELDYPADWTVEPDAQVGSRGSQALLLSPGTTAEKLAEGGSRLSITIYQWDPKGDLAAYVTQRRTAWDASGFKVLDGSVRELSDGRPASDFYIEAPDGTLAYFLLTTNGDQYIQLAGEGDLALLETLARTFRPIAYQP